MSEPVICIGVEANAKNSDIVTVGYYRSRDKKQRIAATEMGAVFSPYDGQYLKTLSSSTVDMKVGALRKDKNVTSTGACPTCATEHFVTANALEHFVEEGNNIYCTLCGTEYEPLISPEALEEYSNNNLDDNDDDDTNIAVESSTEDEDLETTAAEDDDDEDEEDSEDMDDDETNPPVHETQNMNDKPAETTPAVETPATETTNNDLMHGGEEVSASVTEFQINAFDSAGDLTKQKLNLVKVNDNYALVLADDQPIIKLYADKAGDNKHLFENYKTLSKAFAAILSEANPDFSSIGGEPIEFAVKVDQQIAKKIEAGVLAATEALKAEKATMAEEFSQSLMTAASIVNKNIVKDVGNPLRDNIVKTLTQLNVRNAATAADTILEASSEDYINTIIAQAESYREKPLEARNTIALFVNTANYNKEADAKTVQADMQKEFSKSLSDGNVMFSTAGTIEPDPVSIKKAQSAGIDHYRSMFK